MNRSPQPASNPVSKLIKPAGTNTPCQLAVIKSLLKVCFLLPPPIAFVPDVDECKEKGAVCGDQGVCVNTLGSYTCACQPGYRGNGTHCEGKQLAVTFHGTQMAAPPTPLRVHQGVGWLCSGGFCCSPGPGSHELTATHIFLSCSICGYRNVDEQSMCANM